MSNQQTEKLQTPETNKYQKESLRTLLLTCLWAPANQKELYGVTDALKFRAFNQVNSFFEIPVESQATFFLNA